MSTIELGEVSRGRVGAVPERRSPRRMVRAIVPLALVVAFVGGSVRPALPLAVAARVAVGLEPRILIAGSSVIVADTRDGQGRISAYSLDGGALRWTVSTQILSAAADIWITGNVVMLSGSNLDMIGPHTQAFDARTGEHLWDDAGAVIEVNSADEPVLVSGDDADTGQTFQGVDRLDGQRRWSVPVPGGCLWETTADPARDLRHGLVEFCQPIDGVGHIKDLDHAVLRTVDLDTGAVRAERTLDLTPPVSPFPQPVDEMMPSPQFFVAGDIVVVAHQDVPTPTVDGYQVDTLAPLWSGIAISHNTSLEPCGTEICLVSGAVSTLLDRYTGRPAAPAGPVSTPATSTLVLLPDRVPGGMEYLSAPNLVDYPAGTSAIVPQMTAGSVWLAIQRTGASGRSVTTPIQPLPGVSLDGCAVTGGYLACMTGTTEMTFWHQPA